MPMVLPVIFVCIERVWDEGLDRVSATAQRSDNLGGWASFCWGVTNERLQNVFRVGRDTL